MGVAGVVYAGASIAWVLLLGRAAIVDTLLVMLATYAFVVVALCAVWFVPSRKDAASGEVAAPLVQTVSDTCLELAGRYALSPRETEVFVLLAQGRKMCLRDRGRPPTGMFSG